ncbi:hypothetical protein [Providencia stuartii]|nr:MULTISPECIES: hypothetical protein [Providencia]MDE8747365.1 hypothetical protein [Providencia thailandensis]MDE8766371.1 hypothetical protein [Providencia thailandensis]MDE8778608.1 hypothetical protein [Providencia thailandensis]MDE8782634.1 hypothetical protein [Providencia thailandensis]MDE8786628.1 hypothetical protein [Providencia thailandensis]
MPKEITSRFAEDITDWLQYRLDPERPMVKVVHSSIGSESASLGAAMLSLYQIINQ